MPLIYAAIEFRLACERVLFELYLFLKNPYEFDIKSESKNLKNTSALIAAIHRVFENKGFLNLAQIFNQFYATYATKGNFNIAIVDTGLVHSYWSYLSEFCHMQFDPSETWESKEWVVLHYKKVEEIDKYLSTIFNENTAIGWVRLNSVLKQVLDIREDFMNMKIDEETMMNRVKLAIETHDTIKDFKNNLLSY